MMAPSMQKWAGHRNLWPTPHGFPKEGQARNPGPSGNELGRAVNREMWGTPTSRDWKDTGDMTNVPTNGLLGRQVLEREMWPTPTKSDGEGGPGNSGRDGGLNLRTAAGGSLNPTWVEWLMGFPLGWTDLEASETP
jgi:DNA (cytosine-5)-methyltransferase 1